MRTIVSLDNGKWRFGAVSQKAFGFVFDLDEVEDWLPATVPGDARLDLLKAGRIPDPFFGTDNRASDWVDALDWWFTHDVDDEGGADARRFLIFEGIDYQCAVFWNGKELGRHRGMFSRQTYELPGEGAGTIAVRVWGANALPRLEVNPAERFARTVTRLCLPANPAFPDRLATLKCQMSFGWDFAPRLRTCGIWDDAMIVRTGSVFIRDVQVFSVPDGRVRLLLDLDAERELVMNATVEARGVNFANETQRFRGDLTVSPDREKYEFSFRLLQPKLWNPWDRGDANLYELCLTLTDGTEELDSTTIRFGLRTIDLAPNPNAPLDEPPWTFVVNRVSEFIRGANWVPPDAFPGRLKREDYEELVHLAKAANINLLRVWGGGLREKSAFYDLCDEEGILVWQEFPFSGAPFDYIHRDDEFLSFTRAECGAVVRTLRNHPSLALWCGGNEFSAASNSRLVQTLRETVAENDGTRHFKPNSPSAGEDHNWRVWHGSANTRDYRAGQAGFYGEFGLQSPPAVKELKRFIPDQELWPPGESWMYHNAELAKLRRYACSIGPDSGTLEDFVRLSQMAQLRGLQVMIEHARRSKGRVSGCSFWQFDEPWPAICWSVLDYARRPKPAYFKIKELYNPILVSFAYPLIERSAGDMVLGDLWVINDTLRPLRGELRGSVNGVLRLKMPVKVGPNMASVVSEFRVALTGSANMLDLELAEDGVVISTNEYDLNYCDHGEISWLSSLVESASARLKK